MTAKARQAETQSLPSTIKHLDLVLVLDKSGSMYGLESDTIGGYNAMIAKEKDLDVDTKVTTVLFNNKVDILTDRSNINSLSDMTTKDYRVGGSTALLDAVGNTIAKISDTPGISDKDHKVIFVIITDGLENASTEYSKATIQKMISDKKPRAGTSFPRRQYRRRFGSPEPGYRCRPCRQVSQYFDGRPEELRRHCRLHAQCRSAARRRLLER